MCRVVGWALVGIVWDLVNKFQLSGVMLLLPVFHKFGPHDLIGCVCVLSLPGCCW